MIIAKEEVQEKTMTGRKGKLTTHIVRGVFSK